MEELTGHGKVIRLFDVVVENSKRDKLLTAFFHDVQIAEDMDAVRFAGSTALVALSELRAKG